MKIIFVYLMIITSFGCKNEKQIDNKISANEVNIVSEIDKLSKEFDIKLNCKVEKQLETEKVQVFIEMLEPYKLSNNDMQELFSAYAISKIKSLREFKEIQFHYYINKEKDINTYTLSYNENDISDILKGIENNIEFQNLIEYSLSKMKEVDPYTLQFLQERVNTKYTKNTIKGSIFKLLFLFSNKTGNHFDDSNRQKMGDITFTIFNMYDLSKRSDEIDFVRARSILNDYWQIIYNKSVDESIEYNKESKLIYLKD